MADLIGRQLGNYRLIRLLGRGGFAEVYLGEHTHLGTQTAIKLLHTQLAGGDIEFFRREARTIAQLVHPHIVRVFDFGIEGETPFLVMDYAPNGNVRKQHPKGVALPLPTIQSYVKQVASALQYAHDEQFIHRDVKPENLLIGRRQEILLSDFGIALIAQTSRSQSMQDVAGTASYMAPEQFQGKPRPASDQYALGIMVYEWLTGGCPFHGSFTEIASQHLFQPPPPLKGRVPNISPAIEEVVMTALAKDPHSRFGSVQAFATAFEQASQIVPTHQGVVPAQLIDEKRSTPLSQPLLSTPVMVPPNQLAVPTEPVTSPGQAFLPTEPVASGPVTSPSQEGKQPAVAVPSSLAETVLPKTPPSREPVPALEKEKATPPDQALLPTVPAGLSPAAPVPSQFEQVPEVPMPGPAQGERRKVLPRSKIAIVSLVCLIVVIVGGVAYAIISSNSALNRAVAAAQATATAAAQAGNPNPYGGTLVVSDSMSGPGSAFAWQVRNDQYGQCNFKNGAFHVFGLCGGYPSISTKFAFEIYLSAGGNCGELGFYSHSAQVAADAIVCQNGYYDINTDVTATNGEVSGTTSAMLTGVDQPNIIGIVSDGTNVTLFVNHVQVASVAGVYTDLFALDLNGYALGSDGIWSANHAEVAYTDARLWSL